MKKTMKEQRVERQRKTKKIIFNCKKFFGKGSFIYDVHSLNFRLTLPSSPLSTNIQFWSKQIPLLDVLNWYYPPSPIHHHPGLFRTYNLTYNFFFANTQSIYYSHMSHMYHKTGSNTNSFSPSQLL